MTTLDDYIAATDWSDLYSTDPGAVRAICMAAASVSPATILELGSHRGLTAAALAIACPEATVVGVDLSDEVLPDVRIAHYRRWGVGVHDYQGSSASYLSWCDHYDVIFHDSIHGEAAIDEYRAAWAKTRKILVIHDWEQVNRDIGLGPPQREQLVHIDTRGRITAMLWK